MTSGCGSLPACLSSRGRVRDRADLHVGQAGDDQAEPDAAQAEHRVLLVQPAHRGRAASGPSRWPSSPASAILTDRSVRSGRNSCSGGSISRIVTGRPSMASRISTKSPRCSGSRASSACWRSSSVLGQDQVLDQLAALAEEHVLGADQADAAGAEPAGAGAVRAGVRVGVHAEAALVVGVHHDRVHGPDQVVGLVGVRVQLALEVAHDLGRDDRDLAQVDDTAGAVDGDHVALADRDAAGRGELLRLGVHFESLGAADAGLAHAAGDHGRVAGLAAAAGQDALGGDHAVQVVRVGLAADQDDLLALGGQLDGAGASRRRPCRPPRPATRSPRWRSW